MMPTFFDQTLVGATASLAANFAVVVGGIFIFSLMLDSRLPRHGRVWKVLIGIGFGLLTIISMISPIHIREGIIIDAKYPLTLISTLYGGPFAGFLTATICGAARTFIGGMGVYAALPTLLVTWLTGIAFLRYGHKPATTSGRFLLYLLLGSLQWVYQFLGGFMFLLFLPWNETLPIIFDRSIPAILIYPPTTVLLGLSLDLVDSRHALLRSQQIAENTFHKIFEFAPLRISIFRKLDDTLFMANPNFYRNIGKNPEQCENRPPNEFLSPQDLNLYAVIRDKFRASNNAIELSFEVNPPDSTTQEISTRATGLDIEGEAYILIITESERDPSLMNFRQNQATNDMQLQVERLRADLRGPVQSVHDYIAEVRNDLDDQDIASATKALEKAEYTSARIARILNK